MLNLKLDVVQLCETQKVSISHERWAHTSSSVNVGKGSLGQWIWGVMNFKMVGAMRFQKIFALYCVECQVEEWAGIGWILDGFGGSK